MSVYPAAAPEGDASEANSRVATGAQAGEQAPDTKRGAALLRASRAQGMRWGASSHAPRGAAKAQLGRPPWEACRPRRTERRHHPRAIVHPLLHAPLLVIDVPPNTENISGYLGPHEAAHGFDGKGDDQPAEY